MITMYTGTPGSGKSLHVAREIYHTLRRAKNVIANFDVNLSVFGKRKIGQFLYFDNSELSSQLLIAWALEHHRRSASGHIIEGQTLIVLDECQVLFNARSWNVSDRSHWCTFFNQHRKYGYNVILITQFDRLVDRQIRSLVEYEVKHRRVSNFKAFGFLLGIFFGGNLFVAVTMWYGIRERCGADFFAGRKKYFSMYDSYRLFAAGAQTGATGAPASTGCKLPESAVEGGSSAAS